MKAIWIFAAICSGLAAFGQNMANAVLPENATMKVSDHVWAIMGFPNVAIVVGGNAALVVDTGMGPRNGKIIMREVGKLFKGQKIFLTTTHFHPEHAGGEQGFPPQTILVRPAVQQKEMNEHGMEMIARFSQMNALNKELLEGVTFRQPDMVFDTEAKLDLGGGVTARLMWTGGGHTLGDELIYVEPDNTLISGDIVEKNTMPALFGDASSMKRWLGTLDKLSALKPRYVFPDHGELGDGSLLPQQKAFMTDLQNRALELRKQGKTLDQAAADMATTMKAKYPAYNINGNNMSGLVNKVWAEN
jgi:glyoxylase-like metal-dependent hydrolase (beta-lactamase superfamily II)